MKQGGSAILESPDVEWVSYRDRYKSRSPWEDNQKDNGNGNGKANAGSSHRSRMESKKRCQGKSRSRSPSGMTERKAGATTEEDGRRGSQTSRVSGLGSRATGRYWLGWIWGGNRVQKGQVIDRRRVSETTRTHLPHNTPKLLYSLGLPTVCGSRSLLLTAGMGRAITATLQRGCAFPENLLYERVREGTLRREMVAGRDSPRGLRAQPGQSVQVVRERWRSPAKIGAKERARPINQPCELIRPLKNTEARRFPVMGEALPGEMQ
jgi:hypothetical protein